MNISRMEIKAKYISVRRYDGAIPGWRVTDCNFSEALIYDTWMGKGKFYDTGLEDSEFNYIGFDRSTFKGGSFRNCKIENCE